MKINAGRYPKEDEYMTRAQRPHGTNGPPIIIGLDPDSIPVRLVYATTEPKNHGVPYVIEARAFKTAKSFRNYWKRYSKAHFVVVAIPETTRDPLGLIPWLQGQGASTESYYWWAYDYHLGGDFEVWGLKKAFARPFVLALYASYGIQSWRVVQHLWTRAATAQGILTELRDGLHRLSAALPAFDLRDEHDYEPEQLEFPY
ncbi:hypothetical protein IV102_24800 [bacterium]|nr:hypothetical protein [bacterium]